MRDGLEWRKIQYTAIIRTYASTRPSTGAITINASVLGHCPTTSPSKALAVPKRCAAFAMAAPAYPPISACDELVGNPNHQVMTSQTIPPITPARSTSGVTISTATNPLPTVPATPVPNVNADTKLKKADQTTA